MALQRIYVDYDFNQNQVLNARQHPLTTAQRTALGATLGPLGEGMLVFDIDENLLYAWTGSEWTKVNQEHYRHVQTLSSSVWTIRHSLKKHPAVSIVDSAGNEVEGDVFYNDTDTVTLTFSSAFSGEAYCN